jgi:hypothetical protein
MARKKEKVREHQQSMSWSSLFFCTMSPFHKANTTGVYPLEGAHDNDTGNSRFRASLEDKKIVLRALQTFKGQ